MQKHSPSKLSIVRYVSTHLIIVTIVLSYNITNASIQLDQLLPVIHKPYQARATLVVRSYYEPRWYHSPVEFSIRNMDKKCIVTDWKFCNKEISLKEWTCGCSNRFVDPRGNIKTYRFYVNLGKVGKKFEGERISVTLKKYPSVVNEESFTIVRFTEKPRELINACMNSEIPLKWFFLSGVNAIQKAFQIVKLEWSMRQKGAENGEWELVARLVRYPNKTYSNTFISDRDVFEVKKYAGYGSDSYYLNYKDFDRSETTELKIDATFNTTRFTIARGSKWNLPMHNLKHLEDFYPLGLSQKIVNESIPIEDNDIHSKRSLTRNLIRNNRYTPSGQRNTRRPHTRKAWIIQRPNYCSDPNYPGRHQDPRCTTTSITTTTTTVKTTTTIVPVLDYPPETNQLEVMSDIVTLEPIVPPGKGTKAVITSQASHTVSGHSLVTCIIRGALDKLGSPTVNTTLWTKIGAQPKKVFASRAGQLRMQYQIRNTRDLIFFCGLQGKAMKCVPKGDVRAKVVSVNASMQKTNDKQDEPIDFFLILYGLEVLVTIFILLWTASTFMEHLRLILWRERLRIDQKTKAEMIRANASMRTQQRDSLDTLDSVD